MFPIEVSFRNFEHSDAVHDNIMKQAVKLDRVFDRIHTCRVVVSAPHRHNTQGKVFHVNIQVRVPGKELVVSHEPELNKAHEDMFVTIRDAFKAMKQELEHYARKLRVRRQTPSHLGSPQGKVIRLFPEEGYGFISSEEDGAEYYFHENSVLGEGFDNLDIGDLVRFSPESGVKGPQASSLDIVQKGTA